MRKITFLEAQDINSIKGSYKYASYRFNSELLTAFREVCKEYNIKQVALFERAMRATINEAKILAKDKK